MTSHVAPIRLSCGCQPSVSRCPIATELWAQVEAAASNPFRRGAAMAEYKAHVDAGWAAR